MLLVLTIFLASTGHFYQCANGHTFVITEVSSCIFYFDDSTYDYHLQSVVEPWSEADAQNVVELLEGRTIAWTLLILVPRNLIGWLERWILLLRRVLGGIHIVDKPDNLNLNFMWVGDVKLVTIIISDCSWVSKYHHGCFLESKLFPMCLPLYRNHWHRFLGGVAIPCPKNSSTAHASENSGHINNNSTRLFCLTRKVLRLTKGKA